MRVGTTLDEEELLYDQPASTAQKRNGLTEGNTAIYTHVPGDSLHVGLRILFSGIEPYGELKCWRIIRFDV